MATALRPCADWIVATTKRVERLTTSGLHLPAVSMAEDEGVVEAVGPNVTRCSVGDRIVFTHCRSKQDAHGDHRYLIQDQHVIATYDEE